MKSVFGIGKNTKAPKLCVEEAVKEIKAPQLIFFFSGEKNFSEYAGILHERFPAAVCIGCSTGRTWNGLGSQTDVLNVMAIEEGISCAANVIPKADNFALGYVDHVRECLEQMDSTENSVCVEFTIPYKQGEEYILMVLNSVLLRHEIPVIGGSAGNTDSLEKRVEEAYISLNGEVYTDGCVFVIIHNLGGAISLYKENIYEPLTGNRLDVTKANDQTRTIMTINDIPALEVYAEELGVSVEEADQYFFHYPMGRRIGQDDYITAIQEGLPNGYMKFLARVQEGVKMVVLKEGDYRKITDKTLEDIKNASDKPALVLMFHCVARSVFFEGNGYIDEYPKLLSDAFPNFIGFDCFGEQLGTKNFNHTMLLAVFE